MRCDYHIDHGHETNRCRSLKFMVESLIKAGHLGRYIKDAGREEESAPITCRIIAGVIAPPEPRLAINYILEGSFDDQYQSKRQQKKLLRVATVKAWVNTVYTSGSQEETKPIDGLISFPPINPNRVIMPHYDAFVLTHCINGFDVHNWLHSNVTNYPYGNKERKGFRWSSPWGSHSCVATIARHLSKGGRKGSVSCGSFGGSCVGWAGEITYVSTLLSSEEK